MKDRRYTNRDKMLRGDASFAHYLDTIGREVQSSCGVKPSNRELTRALTAFHYSEKLDKIFLDEVKRRKKGGWF